MGAATAVLDADTTSSHPIAFLASKSWFGHSEPAAGMLALAHAYTALSHLANLPMLHLHMLNPHIADALSSRSADHRPIVAARQLAAMPHGHNSHGQSHGLVCGISAFAFQGTNAHAIMSVEPAATTAIHQPTQHSRQLPFKHQHYWVAPLTHPLLATFPKLRPQLAVMEGRFGSPGAAYLWDHMVSGRVLMPAAASFDLACSAASLLLPHGSAQQVSLTRATLPAPLILPQQRHAQTAAALSVQVSLDLTTGKVTLASASLQQTHLVGYVQCALHSTQTAAAPSTGSHALARLQTIHQTDSTGLSSAAVGMLADSAHAQSGDGLTPAQLDCSFHLAAALPMSGAGHPADSPATLRVPVAAQSVMLGNSTGHSQTPCFAVAQAQAPASDGSLEVSFSIPAFGEVQQLVTKPLQSSKAQAMVEAPQTCNMLYVMSRPASNPAQQLPAAESSLCQHVSLVGSNDFATYARALAVAQDAATGALRTGQRSLILQTTGVFTSSLTAQPAAPAAQGSTLLGLRALAKTVGHENPLMPCHAVDTHPADANCSAGKVASFCLAPSSSSTAQRAQHGSAQQAGVEHTSKLLPLAAGNITALAEPFQLMPLPRG